MYVGVEAASFTELATSVLGTDDARFVAILGFVGI